MTGQQPVISLARSLTDRISNLKHSELLRHNLATDSGDLFEPQLFGALESPVGVVSDGIRGGEKPKLQLSPSRD